MDIIKTNDGKIDLVIQDGDDLVDLYKDNLVRYLNNLIFV